MHSDHAALYPDLAAYVRSAEADQHLIPADRRKVLERLAEAIRTKLAAGEPAQLVFICTHNSRRSHLAQVWAETAAFVHGVGGVETFSGGTEATAFDRRAVAALQRAGFRVERSGDGENPVYAVRFSDRLEPMACFSKRYDQPPNPQSGYCAVMTCAAADEACPVVLGAAERIALRYDDPKDHDGTPGEQAAYDARCRQIATEMLVALRSVAR